MNEKLLKIQEAAKLLGVSIKTLQRWEAQGFIKSERTPGAHRRYSLATIEAIKMQMRLRKSSSFYKTSVVTPPTVASIPEVQKEVAPETETLTTTTGFIDSSDKPRRPKILKPLLTAFTVISIFGLAASAVALGKPFAEDIVNSKAGKADKGDVLAAQTGNLKGFLNVNVPAFFNDGIFVKNGAEFEGESLFLGPVNVENADITVTNGSVFADNLLYTLTAGDGISVVGGQNPVISNTGVLSLNDQAGDLDLVAGSGISIDGLTITNTASNIYKTIKVGSDSVSAGSSTDTFEFASGTGISLSLDTSSKKLTINGSALSDSGFTDDGTTVRLTTITDNVGIGTASASEKLHVVGNAIITGSLTLGNSTISQVDGDGLSLTGGVLSIDLLSSSASAGLASSRSGLELNLGAGSEYQVGLLQGCQNGQILKWDAPSGVWACASDVGGQSQAVIAIQEGTGGLITGIDTLRFTASDFDLGSVSTTGTISLDASLARWDKINGTATLGNSTLDILAGGNSTNSAKFGVLNLASGIPTASVSATSTGNAISIAGDGTIQSQRNNTLTIGGSTTGNIILSPLNGSGSVTSTGSLNLASGKTYQIGGTDVLSSTTLGSSVINSSLQTVGTISSGIWQGTAIGSQFGGTGLDTSSSTGVPIISSGTWSVVSQLSALRGGTGIDGSGATNGQILIGNGTGYSLNTISAGAGISISNGSGTITISQTGAGGSKWTEASGALFPNNATLDVLLGGTSTSSAKFAFLNMSSGVPTASVSAAGNGASYLTAAGNLATTLNRNLTLGGTTTGDIIFDPLGGSGKVQSTGTFSIATGKTYQINGTDVLSTNTLGSSVINSSLQTVGTINAGAWNATAIAAQYGGTGLDTSSSTGVPTLSLGTWSIAAQLAATRGGTGIDTSSSTGVPVISGGTWSVASQLSAARGGTGVDGSTATNGQLLIGNGAGYTLATLTAGGGISVSNGSGTISIASTLTPSNWTLNPSTGVLTPNNATLDVLLGGTSSSSAKFGFLNNAGGTPTASISGNSGNNSTYLTGLGNLGTTNAQTLSLGGSTTGNIVIDSGSGLISLLDATSISGALSASGAITFSNAAYTNNNSVLYGTSGTGVLAAATTNTAGLCLQSGASTPTWSSCPGSGSGGSKWTEVGGLLFPNNATVDVLLGGTSTSSAKFAFSGVSAGTPTASISANSGNNALFLTGAGNLGTTNAQTLSLGGSTTGNIVIDSGSGLISFLDNTSITGDFSSTGTITFSNGTYTGNNSVLYGTSGTGVLAASTTNTSGLCLQSGASAPTWSSCPGSGNGGSKWTELGGLLFPNNATVDVLFGGTSSSSAKFAFTGVSGGTPTASISANSGNNALFLAGNGNIGTTNMQTLTLGGSTTGNILLTPNTGGYVGITSGELRLTPVSSLASTTEGTIYYDSDDDQVKVYANGKWQADRSTATLIVAASNSQNSEKADYVADGTDDDVTIESAITALPAGGGVVVLLDGTYSIGDAAGDGIDITKSNVSIIGAGKSTILQRQGDTASIDGVITATSVSNITIADLAIDGVKGTYAGAENGGIYFSTTVTFSTIRNAYIHDNDGRGIYMISSSNNLVTDSDVRSNDSVGILLSASSSNTITNTNIQSSGNSNIQITASSSNYNVISNNTILSATSSGITIDSGACCTNTLITSNIIRSNTWYGVDLSTATNNTTISNNSIESNSLGGIRLFATSFNTVTGNVLDSNSGHSIILTTNAANNTISGNNISTVAASSDGINLSSSDNNNITGNVINDTTGSRYGINVSDSTSDNNYIASNEINGAGFTEETFDAGTNTTIQHRDRFAIEGNSIGKALLTLNQTGSQNIISASAAGVTKFALDTLGNISFAGGQTSNFTTLTSLNTQAATFTIPSTSGVSDTFCLQTLNNCAGTNYWNLTNGALSPIYASVADLLLGSNATASAKFGFLNVNSGTPTASISANSGDNATTLSGLGVLGTTNKQTLSIGNTSTGDINLVVNAGNNLRINGAIGITDGTPQCVTTTNGIVTGSGTCQLGTEQWVVANGFIYTGNPSLDFGLGGTSTASSKFAVLNISGGTPTASISANSGNNATFLTGTGNLGTTNRQALIIGGTTTGDIILNPTNSTGNITINSNHTGSLGALNINQNSGGTGIVLDDITTGTNIVVDSLISTGTGIRMSGLGSLSSGVGLNMSANASGGISAFTGDFIRIATTRSSANSTLTDTGNFIDLSRSNIVNNSVGTYNLTGEVARFASNCTETAGTCVDTSNILRLIQNFGKASGAVLDINNFGVGSAAAITSNSGGQSALIVNKTGNAGDILTASSSGSTRLALDINGNLRFAGGQSGAFTTLASLNSTAATFTLPNTSGVNDTFCLQNLNNCAGTNYWNLSSGALSPIYASTLDLLLGSNATSSAKFGFLNVNSGTPTASISANSGNNATFLTGLGNLGTTNAQTLSLGGSTTGNITLTPGGAGNIYLNSDGDSNIILPALIGAENAILFADSSTGALQTTTISGAGYCLMSGISSPTWDVCPGSGSTNYWQLNNKLLSPINNTYDFAIGGTATTSAKFAVLNVAGGTPTASISANNGNNATYLTGDGTLSTTNRQTLTLGGSGTGHIAFNSAGTTAMTINSAGNVGIGTTNPSLAKLQVAGSNNSIGLYVSGGGITAGGYNSSLHYISVSGSSLNSNETQIYLAGLMTAATGIDISSVASAAIGLRATIPVAGLTSGKALYVTGSQSSASTAFTGDIIGVDTSRTFSTAGSSITDTGNYLDLNRSNTVNNSTATFNITGDLANLTSNCTQTAGTCVDTSNLLRLTQNFGKASGAVLNIENFGVGSAAAILSNSGGQSALIVNKTGNAGDILTASASGVTRLALDVNGNLLIGTSSATTERVMLAGGNFLHTAASDPTLKSTLDTTSGNSFKINISGKYAYMANQSTGIQIIDISNPASPTVISTYDIGAAVDLQVVGKYLYVADNSLGLQVIDVSNPLAPQLRGSLATSGNANGIFVSGKYAYVADNTDGLKIIDISNPTLPQLVSSVSTGTFTKAVYVSGKYAYVTAGATGDFSVIDISNPTSPRSVGNFDLTSNGRDVYVSGKYAYVAETTAGLLVLDISNPGAPRFMGRYSTSDNAETVYVGGRYAYVAAGSAGLLVIDVSNPTSMNRVGSYDTAGTASGIDVSGKYAYVADGTSGLAIIDIAGIETPSLYAGILGTNDLTVTENADIGNNLYIRNSLNIGEGGLMSNGAFSFVTASGAANLIEGAPTGRSLLTLNQTGSMDIFTASSSGSTRFTINNNGNLQFAGGQSSTYTTLASLNTQAATFTIPSTSGVSDTFCLQTLGNCSGGTNYWQLSSGMLSPINSTLDFALGGTSTSAAKFSVLNMNSGIPTASISANSGNNAAFLTGSGNLATTNRQTLTLGGSTTGDISITPSSGTGFLDISGAVRQTYAGTSGTGLSLIGNSVNTGTLASLSGTGFTTGNILDITGTYTPNDLDTYEAIDINLTRTGAGQDYFIGQSLTLDVDSLTNENSTGIYSQVNLTGNAERIGTGIVGDVTSNSNTGDNITGVAGLVNHSGSISSDTQLVIGGSFNAQSNGASSGGLVDIRGISAVASGTSSDGGGVINGSGLYIANGTFDTTGTTAQYGIYLEPLSGADTNVGICFDCDGTWDQNNVGSGIQFGTDANLVNLYRNASDTLRTDDKLSVGTLNSNASNVLCYDGSNILSTCAAGTFASTNYWQLNSNALSQSNNTFDVLFGATSTTSAKFAFLNNAGGTPTASISANSGNTALYIKGDGNIGTTNRGTLTIGNSSANDTTGNVLINPNGTGNVGIGTTSPTSMLEVASSPTTTDTRTATFKFNGDGLTNVNESYGVLVSASTPNGSSNFGSGKSLVGISSTVGNNASDVESTIGYLTRPYVGFSNTITNTYGFVAKDATGFGGTITNQAGFISENMDAATNNTNLLLGTTTIPSGNYSIYNSSDYNNYIAGNVGIGNVSSPTPLTTLHVDGSNSKGRAVAIIDQTASSLNDIFAASASGTTKFRITNDGSLVLAGGQASALTTITSSNATARTINIPSASGSDTFCLQALANCTGGAVTNFWQLNANALSPANSTFDVLFGGTSTSSAKFAFLNNAGGTPTASISAESANNALFLSGNGNIGTTNRQTLTLGGSTTGEISIPNKTILSGSITGNALFVDNTNSSGNGLRVDIESASSSQTAFSVTSNNGSTLGISVKGDGTVNIGGAGSGLAKLMLDPPNMTITDSTERSAFNSAVQIITLDEANNLAQQRQNIFLAPFIAGTAGGVTETVGEAATLYIDNAPQLFGSEATITNSYALFVDAGITRLDGNVGIGGVTTPTAALDVRSLLGTSPAASVSGTTSFASLVVNNNGLGDLFTASKSGATKFAINNNGTFSFAGTSNFLATIENANDANATITLPNISGSTDTFCLQTLANCTGGAVTNYWQLNSNAISQSNSTFDVLFGGTSTSSAKFGFLNNAGGTPTASISASSGNNALFLAGNGNIGTVNKQSLSLGGATTGLINMLNGAGSVFASFDTANSTLALGNTGSLNGLLTFLSSNGAETSPTIAAEADGDLTLSAPTGTLNLGSGTGDISFNPNTNNIVMNLASTGDFMLQDNGVTFGIFDDTRKFGLGTTLPLASFDVRKNEINGGTIAVASVSGRTSFASLVVDNTLGDLFTASNAGATKFTISNNGNITAPGIANTNQANTVCYDSTTGAVTYNSGSGCTASSIRYKHDVENLSSLSSLDMVMDLRPVTFKYNSSYSSDQRTQLGFIAEEVYAVNPMLVDFESDGVTPSGVKYANMSALLAGAIKEQQGQIDAISSALNLNGTSQTFGDITAQSLTSNSISAQNITLNGQDLKSTLDENSSSTSAKLTDQQNQISTLLSDINTQNNMIASLSGRLDQLENNSVFNLLSFASSSANFVTVADDLLVLGSSTFNNASIVDTLSIGNSMQITGTSIDTIGQTLALQPLRQGGIDIMGGAITIDTEGKAVFTKDVRIEGVLEANIIRGIDDKLTVSGSAQFDNVAVKKLEVNSTGEEDKSAGVATLEAGDTQITIQNSNVTSNSLIFLTPTSGITGQSLFIKAKVAGQSFTVGLPNAILSDIEFNYLIIN